MLDEFSDIFNLKIYKDFCTQKFSSTGLKGALGRIIYPILVCFGFLTGFILVGLYISGGFVFVKCYSVIKERQNPSFSFGGIPLP